MTPVAPRLPARVKGCFAAMDEGATWSRVASQIEERIDALAYAPADGWVYLAVSDGQVFRGRVNGDEWTPTGAGLGRAGSLQCKPYRASTAV